MSFLSILGARAFICACVFSSFLIAERSFAVDQNPIAKSSHNIIQDERFSLVGVIAEGDGNGKGIAVIRDATQNKTHTLKIGESVPGQGDLTLTKVSRQAVTLHGAQADILVGFNANAVNDSSPEALNPRKIAANSSIDDDDDGGDIESGSTGLFEKWYQNRGPAVLNGMADSPRSIKRLDVPGPIRSRRSYGRSARTDFDEAGSTDDEDSTPPTNVDQSPPTRTEYSDAMRNLIDKYLNSDTPIP